ncbi:MAG: hotdog domain-containing protein [Janthinobacterium lividum]
MVEQASKGYFPAGDANAQLNKIPFARALGLTWQGGNHDGVSLRLPYSALTRNKSTDAVDDRAMVALIDHSCSAAVYAALDRQTLIATLDLRIEFAAPPPLRQDIVCEAKMIHLASTFALVRAEARCAATGQVLAFASSCYIVGSNPGKGANTPPAKNLFEAVPEAAYLTPTADGFDELVAMQIGADRTDVAFVPHLIGAPSLPSLHGGVTASALITEARQRAAGSDARASSFALVTLSMQYLRAGQAKPLSAIATVRKAGGRAVVVEAGVFQDNGSRHVSQGELLFVAG